MSNLCELGAKPPLTLTTSAIKLLNFSSPEGTLEQIPLHDGELMTIQVNPC